MRETTRRIIDLVLTEGLTPPADSRHIKENAANGNTTLIQLTVHNENIREFPFLLRSSLFDGHMYQIFSRETSEGAEESAANRRFEIKSITVDEVNYGNVAKWSGHLEKFALPALRSFPADARALLGKQSLHQNHSVFNACVVAIHKESSSENTSKLLTTYRWYIALRKKEESQFITVGYVRTVFSSPEDPLLPSTFFKQEVEGDYSVDLKSLKFIAGHRFHSVSLAGSNHDDPLNYVSKKYIIAVQCGLFGECSTKEGDKFFKLLEPQLCFNRVPSKNSQSINWVERKWKTWRESTYETNKQLRKFVEEMKSPFFTTYSVPGKKANKFLQSLMENKKKQVLLEENSQLELKNVHGTERLSSCKHSDKQRDVSQSVTEWTCKYATSFANTHGGLIVFGIGDKGDTTGIFADHVKVKEAAFVGFKGIRPVVPHHMATTEHLPASSQEDAAESAFTFTFAVCSGTAPFYAAGAPMGAPAWGRFLSSTVPLHSSVLIERLVMHSLRQADKKRPRKE
ncbi:ATPase AAA [Perkinsela sp. CCAP 1560/4]|nr:ATPase AAA [Perkinsela sp. CCAP 1560/4]|eukprot:KNH08604.1 ATPase AAA [Perkinsela sp. CCAP 1560/4]